MTGSSQSASGSSTIDQFKHFNIFQKQATPRSLKIVMQLLVVVYLVTTSVSSLNMGLNIQRQEEQKSELQLIKASYDRMTCTSAISIILRSILNMANDFEPLNSLFIDDRLTVYIDLLEERQVRLKQI